MQEKKWGRSNGSASVATTLGIVFSAITAFSIFTHYFPNSSSNKSDPQGSIARDPSVIIINEPLRGSCLPMCGFGAGARDSSARMDGEAAYMQKDFKSAIRHFKLALTDNPEDVRSSLGLGKSYVALRQFEQAIDPLCKVRNDCALERKEMNEDANSFNAGYRNLAFAMMPKQACEAIDFEARETLEKALLGKTPAPSQLTNWSEQFRKSGHFLVHRAAMIEARKAHAAVNATRLQAMFQLANENTRTLQLEVQMENTLKDISGDRWHELGELTLNSLIPEESQYYRTLLQYAGSNCGDPNLKYAASSYLQETLDSQDEPSQWAYSPQLQPMEALKSQHERYYAVCAYHDGLLKLRNSYNVKDAEKSLLNALDAFKGKGTREDVADTEYALGIMYFRLDDFDSANKYFKSASEHYRLAGIDSWDADFNCAVLATEYDTRLFEEQMLQDLVARYGNKQANALLGIFEVKRKNYAAAEVPLHDAVKAYIQERLSPPVTQTAEIGSNLVTMHHADRRYTDEELMDAMFKREPRYGEVLTTRYATDWKNVEPEKRQDFEECRHRTTTDHYQDFSVSSTNLYEHVLRKLNHTKQLEQYLKTQKGLHYYKTAKPISIEEQYKNHIKSAFQNAWYPPGHRWAQDAIVRLRINKEGKHSITQLERASSEPRMWKSITDEAIEWVSLAPPPEGLVDKEMILIFNATSAGETQPVALPCNIPMPCVLNEW